MAGRSRCCRPPHAPAFVETHHWTRLKGSAQSYSVLFSAFCWRTCLVAVEGGSSLASRTLDSTPIGLGSTIPTCKKRSAWGSIQCFPLFLVRRLLRVNVFLFGVVSRFDRSGGCQTAHPALWPVEGQNLVFFYSHILNFWGLRFWVAGVKHACKWRSCRKMIRCRLALWKMHALSVEYSICIVVSVGGGHILAGPTKAQRTQVLPT